ncbi:MAG: metal ABC transporter permease [Endomicrobium sp.]|jgi:manganese/iron transport system permease protein|nr:metal ABC transporter permease [Endomicrobium sp.]
MEFLYSYFFIKALTASFFAGLACGIIGVWVYLLNIPFVGVAMTHTAFAGAILGLFFGINPIVAALIFCVLSSLMIGPVAEKGNFSPNLSMGILFSFMLGFAFLFMGKLGTKTSEALSLMWGSILIISAKESIALALISAAILLLLLIFNKGIISVIYNRSTAFACGIPEKFIFYLLLTLCAVTVSINIKTIGGLLIYGLITIPPLSAAQITKKLTALYVFSVLFAIASCVLGLFMSYVFDLPAGAAIVMTSSCLFAITVIYKKMFGEKI